MLASIIHTLILKGIMETCHFHLIGVELAVNFSEHKYVLVPAHGHQLVYTVTSRPSFVLLSPVPCCCKFNTCTSPVTEVCVCSSTFVHTL